MAPRFDNLLSNRLIWFGRLLQLIFALAILGITGDNASIWHSIDCSIPTKLAYNIACAALTLPIAIYLLLSTGPFLTTKNHLHIRYWSPWAQLILDALSLLLWITATALSTYDCNGVCASCSAGGSLVDQGYGFTVFFGNWYCPCVFESDYDYKRRGLGKRGGGGGSFKSSGGGKTSGSNAAAGATGETKMAEKAAEIAVKKGLDAVMIFLFLSTLLLTAYYIYRARNPSSGTDEHVEMAVVDVADHVVDKTVDSTVSTA